MFKCSLAAQAKARCESPAGRDSRKGLFRRFREAGPPVGKRRIAYYKEVPCSRVPASFRCTEKDEIYL
jgi:hypothetical protein